MSVGISLQMRKVWFMLPIIVAINDESDRDFVEDIYNKYGKKMYLVAFGVLKKKMDAEDCVHDVIKIIINNIERFRNADYNHLINLIVKCTRNDAINKYNKEKKKREIETDFHIIKNKSTCNFGFRFSAFNKIFNIRII